MKQYKVVLQEVNEVTYYVEATSPEEAEENARGGIQVIGDPDMLLVQLQAQIRTLEEIRGRIQICCVNWQVQ